MDSICNKFYIGKIIIGLYILIIIIGTIIGLIVVFQMDKCCSVCDYDSYCKKCSAEIGYATSCVGVGFILSGCYHAYQFALTRCW